MKSNYPHHCGSCGQGFFTLNAVKRHRLALGPHSAPRPLYTPPPKPRPGPELGPSFCSRCSRWFELPSAMRRHRTMMHREPEVAQPWPPAAQRVLGPDEDWRDYTACRDVDPVVFFPDGPGASLEPARAICATCSVRTACLEYALDLRIKEGVWGGKSERQRRAIRRQRNRRAS